MIDSTLTQLLTAVIFFIFGFWMGFHIGMETVKGDESENHRTSR